MKLFSLLQNVTNITHILILYRRLSPLYSSQESFEIKSISSHFLDTFLYRAKGGGNNWTSRYGLKCKA